MGKFKKIITYFTPTEICIWIISILAIIATFIIFNGKNYLTLLASVIGLIALMFNAKGNPTGHVLGISFALIYGYVSYQCAYYGEMITYVGLSAPMALIAFISWLRNPFKGKKTEVEINKIKGKEYILLGFLATIITTLFYFILKYFNTANLLISTISVTTSFSAVYLTFRRSEYYAVAYGVNDIVLIVLWGLMCIKDISYLSVVTNMLVFLLNDTYAFINWRKMRKRQQSQKYLENN